MSTRRTFLKTVGVGTIAATSLSTGVAARGKAGADLFAPLTSGETVPKVRSRATGTATFTADGDDLAYEVTLKNIVDVTQAHIHVGERGTTGGIVVTLIDFAPLSAPTGAGEDGTPQDPIVVSGTISDSDPELVASGVTVADLLANPAAYYVNVHTVDNQPGEIRGQLRAK
ncbi:CHRD domain-containing protein [Salinigranum salinum]|uniref:CHRD domain-containing protein n=1 Tax=Salinigranum salinum TaxID=1364937 RepID=UPI001260D79E|nr:CHRD domain-containing protein [Salinigranum salinum]